MIGRFKLVGQVSYGLLLGGILIYAAPAGARPFTFRPRVTAVRPEEEILLKGPLRPFGLLRGEQSFHLRTIEGGVTRLDQRMKVSGALFLFGGRDSLDRIGEGMDAMNRAARERLEERTGGPAGEGR